jgi:hypothetical protein
MTTERTTSMPHRALTVLALAALALGLFAGAAAAQSPYPPQLGEVVTADVTITTPGATIRIEGRNWGPGTTIEIRRGDPAEQAAAESAAAAGQREVLATAFASADGTFEADVVIPADADAGDFSLVAVGSTPAEDGGAATQAVEREVALSLSDVSAAGPAAIDGEPAVALLTPGNAAIALLLLAGAGALLLGPVRRRRSEA